MLRSVSVSGSLHKTPSSPVSGVTASASFQSHFSTVNSAHRFRALPGPFKDLEKQDPLEEEEHGLTLSTALNPPVNFVGLKYRFRLAMLAFTCFSALFFPLKTHDGPETEANYISEATRDRRFLSKVTSVGSDPLLIHPFALRGTFFPSDITACLWSRFDQADSVLSWAKGWPGPLSLVITTTTDPASAQHINLLERVSQLYSATSSNSSLSLHLLHVKNSAQQNPNAYINLARLLAQTEKVVLFPRSNLGVDSASAHSLFLQHNNTSGSFKPAVLTASGHSSFPFSPFSPLFLRRDDSVWCDERFALSSSGAFDWEECLWQFWVAKYGNIQTLSISENSWPNESPISETVVHAAVRHRLQTKFREEICLLTTRQINAFITGEGKEAHQQHTKERKWLKRACRQWKFTGV